jgi:hypothetical protein
MMELVYTPAMSVAELEQAILKLKRDELDAFARWFEEYLADEWDRQIEADAASGRLDSTARQATKDYDDGRCTPLRTARTKP